MERLTKKEKGMSTKAVHAGEKRDPSSGSVITPIYQTSVFGFSKTSDLIAVMGKEIEGHTYTRISNPTLRAAEKKVAELEGAEDGAVFSSGMAAITTVIMSLTSSGSHIVSTNELYGGSLVFFNEILTKFGVEISMVEPTNYGGIESAIKANTVAIYTESPTNPTVKVVDLKRVAEIGKERGIISIVDNTFASPYNQQPIKLGMDAVIHSATKYLGGHNDIIAGVVAGSKEFIDSITETRKILGGVLDPHAAWLLIRGMKTLVPRMAKLNQNGIRVARYLESHPKVERVYYPGLVSHPQFHVAKEQMRGFGSVVTFELKGDLETAIKFVDNLKLCALTPSLGGVESLVTQPATSSHYYVEREERLKLGITDGMIRLAVGIEEAEDIISDLEQSFSIV